MEEKLNTLEKKISHLEYDDIAKLKNEINEIKIHLTENNLLTKQAIDTSSELSKTMSIVKETMVQLAESMKTSNRVSEELADNVKSLSDRFVSLDIKVDNKFKEIDEKSKVDILQWISKNWFGVVMGIGAVVYFISQTI